MQFFDAVKIAFQKYADFRGVATRPEYWWFTLFVFLVGLIAGSMDMAIRQGDAGPIQSVLSIALFLPQITMMVRRNRDAGFSAWWLTLWLLPIVVFIYSINANIDTLTKYAQTTNFEALTDQQLIDSLLPLVGVILPGILSLAAVASFFLVVSVLPSKKPKQPTVATIDY
jgi:uncharacterized membrane protein YhaH (DUF805 family)